MRSRLPGLSAFVVLALVALGTSTPPAAGSGPVTRNASQPSSANAAIELALADGGGNLLTTSGTETDGTSAAASTPPRTAPMIRLLAQGPVITEDGVLRLDLAVESADAKPLPGGLGVAVTVHRRCRTRAQFQSTVTGDNLGAVLGLLSSMPINSDGRTEQIVPVELRIGRPSPTCPTCIRLDADGVYPVNVELRNLRTDDVVDRLTTHAIRITNRATPRPRLKVAVVVPLHLPPVDDRTNQVTTTRSFIGLNEAIAGRPLVPLSIAPTPETIEALAQQPDDPVFAQVRASASGREVLSGPYVRWSNTSLERAQLTDEVAAQTALGTNVLRNTLGIEPTLGVLIAGNGIPSADALARAGITTVLAEPRDIVVPGAPLNASAGPVLLNLGGETATPAKPTLVLDAAVQDELSRKRDPARRGGEDVLRAQHVLADFTMLAASRSARGIAVQIPEELPQATLDAILAGLGTTNPVIEPVTVSDLIKLPLQTRSDVPLIVTRNPSRSSSARQLPPGDVLAITGARKRLTGYQSLFTGVAPDLNGLSRNIARLVAADLTTDARRRRLNNANRIVSKLLSQVRLSRPDQLTLTARNAIAPIGVINDTGFPIRVYVTVFSSSVRLRDSGVVVVVDAIGTTKVSQQIDVPGRVMESGVAIETRGPGSFSMVARLTTPDNLELSSERYRLRSTAVSGLGTALTLGSLMVLLVWWLRWGRGARRRSRLRHPAYQPKTERRTTPGDLRSRAVPTPTPPSTPGPKINHQQSADDASTQTSPDPIGVDPTSTSTDVNEPSVPV